MERDDGRTILGKPGADTLSNELQKDVCHTPIAMAGAKAKPSGRLLYSHMFFSRGEEAETKETYYLLTLKMRKTLFNLLTTL